MPAEDAASAEVLRLRGELVDALTRHIAAQGWTQAEAAARLGITQPRVSALLGGARHAFRLDTLCRMAVLAGLDPEVRCRAA